MRFNNSTNFYGRYTTAALEHEEGMTTCNSVDWESDMQDFLC